VPIFRVPLVEAVEMTTAFLDDPARQPT